MFGSQIEQLVNLWMSSVEPAGVHLPLAFSDFSLSLILFLLGHQGPFSVEHLHQLVAVAACRLLIHEPFSNIQLDCTKLVGVVNPF